MKRAIAFVLCLSFLSIMVCGLNVFSLNEINTNLEKLHFYIGCKEFGSIDNYEELCSAIKTIWNINDEYLVMTVKFLSDYSNSEGYLYLINEMDMINSIDGVHHFRRRSNEISRAYHSSLIQQNIHLLESFDYLKMNIISFSPYVELYIAKENVDVNKIVDFIDHETVEQLIFALDDYCVTEASLDSVLVGIDAYDIVTNGDYTGSGINVGIYDDGYCDSNNAFLSGINIVNALQVIPDGYVSPHTTKVTTIAAKIAPDANYYVLHCVGKNISWFIENLCDVVNISMGSLDPPYEYRYDIDGVYDYQAQFSFITIVVSAGNYSEDQNGFHITSPGYIYNGITVGGTRFDGDEIVYDDSSSYISDGTVIKPNVGAFVSVSIPDTMNYSGTSFAAPQVTGSIALLMEKDYTFMFHPEKVKASITASAKRTYGYVGSEYDFDEHVGAGVLTTSRMLDTDFIYGMINSNKIANTNIATYNVYLTAADKIQVGLSWLVTCVPVVVPNSLVPSTISSLYVTDYDVLLYDSNQQQVVISNSSYGNDEIIRFTAESSGYYTIVIRQNTSQSSSYYGDFLSIAININ